MSLARPQRLQAWSLLPWFTDPTSGALDRTIRSTPPALVRS